MVRVPVVVISLVAINKLIGFKAVPRFNQVCSCVGNCRPRGGGLIRLILCNYFVSDLKLFKRSHICFVVYVLIIFHLRIKSSAQGEQMPIGYIPCIFVFHLKKVGDILMLVKNFL